MKICVVLEHITLMLLFFAALTDLSRSLRIREQKHPEQRQQIQNNLAQIERWKRTFREGEHLVLEIQTVTHMHVACIPILLFLDLIPLKKSLPSTTCDWALTKICLQHVSWFLLMILNTY